MIAQILLLIVPADGSHLDGSSQDPPLGPSLGPSLAPSSEETLALELVNRMRADPAAEGQRLAPLRPRPAHPDFDQAMFVDEMEAHGPLPPLVFHPALIAAARNHAAYTAKHKEFGHRETEGREGFTGEFGAARAAHAGYPKEHGRVVENAGSFMHGGVEGCHWASAVDDGPGGPGGMQANRGHRKAILGPRWREFGTGFVTHRDGRMEHAALFGEGPDHRLVGGVIYLDLDGDGFYGIGEGLGSVRVALKGGPSGLSWESGAYALDAGPAQSSPAVDWTATLYDVEVRVKAPPGTHNVKCDASLLGSLEARITALLKVARSGNAAAQKRALSDLAFWAAALPQVTARQELPPASEEAAAQWKARRDRITAALLEGPAEQADLEDDVPRRTLMASWLAEAREVSQLAAEYDEIVASNGSARRRAKRSAKLALNAANASESITMPALRAPLSALRDRSQALASSLARD